MNKTSQWLLAFLLAANLSNPSSAAAIDVPAFYVQRATWQETMLESRLALREFLRTDSAPNQAVTTPVMRGGDAAQLLNMRKFDFEAVRLAIADLTAMSGKEYPNGPAYLQRLKECEQQVAASAKDENPGQLARAFEQVKALQREALLANPLLDFDQLLLVRRSDGNLGLPANWQGNCSLPRSGFDNEIAVLDFPPAASARLDLRTIHQPDGKVFVGDLKLHFEAGRLLFSSLGGQDRWQVFELDLERAAVRQITPGDEPDVDNYDACYLPDGRIIFASTASFAGVPCVDGKDHVANLYLLERDGRIRQLCFDQDHNWSPTVLNDGRVLYHRWEYADTPHSQTRLLFTMNPDGTGQAEFYGSNSYWPNALFYARPIPGHATMVAAIVSGHHGVRRMGELVLFDPARGRHEASGVVQRIPGRGQKVEPIIRDKLVDDSWPKFLHPFPLSEKYFLVSAKPAPDSLWGIYLVDVFDNMLLLAEMPGQALFEPVPLRSTPRPPVIPDKVDLARADAEVVLGNIYEGPGLAGVPRGKVKSLRVYAYHWAYRNMGGLLGTVGLDGPWEPRRILGTVPVAEDGSAWFRVPANTPISVQPLDEAGQAVQLMRSWFTAMPGERVSCTGCHASHNRAPHTGKAIALRQSAPDEIQPWHGPPRGFSFAREVQPVMDRHCVSCHDGQVRDGQPPLDLRGIERVSDFRLITPGRANKHGGKFSVGYANLHRFVRRPGIESDYHLLTPLEFHAGTTELVQILRKGHHGVQLDAESWDRLITWIDMNAPYHGTWHEEISDPGQLRQRRVELRQRYAGGEEDYEDVIPASCSASVGEPAQPATFSPAPPPFGGEGRGEVPHASFESPLPLERGEGRGEGAPGPAPQIAGWPFAAAEAVRKQGAAGTVVRRTIDLGHEVDLELALIPAGEFILGSSDGEPDERPLTPVRISKPFWMARTEISNRQFAQFDPQHDSRVESKTAYQFGIHGYPLNEPDQPVVRVSWEQAMAFCDWLSRETGVRFSLPTEAQWEWACRAGSAAPFSFGGRDADFSKFANLADAKLSEFASDPYTVCTPLKNPSRYEDYIPKEIRFNDGGVLTSPVAAYQPNAWGLHDLHGNVWEWTRSSYRAYPYREDDGRNEASSERKVVRGGSWRDRPHRSTASYRLAYEPWQRVFNVGFRVVAAVPAEVALQREE